MRHQTLAAQPATPCRPGQGPYLHIFFGCTRVLIPALLLAIPRWLPLLHGGEAALISTRTTAASPPWLLLVAVCGGVVVLVAAMLVPLAAFILPGLRLSLAAPGRPRRRGALTGHATILALAPPPSLFKHVLFLLAILCLWLLLPLLLLLLLVLWVLPLAGCLPAR